MTRHRARVLYRSNPERYPSGRRVVWTEASTCRFIENMTYSRKLRGFWTLSGNSVNVNYVNSEIVILEAGIGCQWWTTGEVYGTFDKLKATDLIAVCHCIFSQMCSFDNTTFSRWKFYADATERIVQIHLAIDKLSEIRCNCSENIQHGEEKKCCSNDELYHAHLSKTFVITLLLD